MTRSDLVAQFLVGTSSALVPAVINLAGYGQIGWVWLIPAFLAPFIVLSLYQRTGIGFRLYQEYKICNGELIAWDGTQRDAAWEFEGNEQARELGFYGPYIALPKGKYRAKFRLKIDKRDARDMRICHLDVTSNSGEKWFAHQTVSIRDFEQSDQWQDFILDFTMLSNESKVEFRAFMNDLKPFKLRITFDKVVIFRRLV
jgi:hypothetical protein